MKKKVTLHLMGIATKRGDSRKKKISKPESELVFRKRGEKGKKCGVRAIGCVV